MSQPRTKVKYYDDPVAVGRRLRETREAAGLSQRELSFPGCTAAYISRIEKGERVPSLQLIREFAGRLGVSEQFLAHGQEDEVTLSPRENLLKWLIGECTTSDLELLQRIRDLPEKSKLAVTMIVETFEHQERRQS